MSSAQMESPKEQRFYNNWPDVNSYFSQMDQLVETINKEVRDGEVIYGESLKDKNIICVSSNY